MAESSKSVKIKTVYVVMGNDFPEAVLSTEQAADKFIKKMKGKPGDARQAFRIHWRYYSFQLNKTP